MQVVAVQKIRNIKSGPWLWSSGQRARLLLRRSEFESRWGLQFFCIIVIEKNENKQTEAGVGPFLKKKVKKSYWLLRALMAASALGVCRSRILWKSWSSNGNNVIAGSEILRYKTFNQTHLSAWSWLDSVAIKIKKDLHGLPPPKLSQSLQHDRLAYSSGLIKPVSGDWSIYLIHINNFWFNGWGMQCNPTVSQFFLLKLSRKKLTCRSCAKNVFGIFWTRLWSMELTFGRQSHSKQRTPTLGSLSFMEDWII